MKKKLDYMALAIISVSIFSMGQPHARAIHFYFLETGDGLPRSFSPIWFIIIPLVALALNYIGRHKYGKQIFVVMGGLLAVNIILGFNFVPTTGAVFVNEVFTKPIKCLYIVIAMFCGYSCMTQDTALRFITTKPKYLRETGKELVFKNYYQGRGLAYFISAAIGAIGLLLYYPMIPCDQLLQISILLFIATRLMTVELKLVKP